MGCQSAKVGKPPAEASSLTLCKTEVNGASVPTTTCLASQNLTFVSFIKTYFCVLTKYHVASGLVIQGCVCLAVVQKAIYFASVLAKNICFYHTSCAFPFFALSCFMFVISQKC